jgi:hypothetical protein
MKDVKEQESKAVIVITSINPPNTAVKIFADGADDNDISLCVIGDAKSPKNYCYNNIAYYSLEEQKELKYSFSKLVPENHYARKNIGYLLAMEKKSVNIIDTDDDNIPYTNFWKKIDRVVENTPYINNSGWVNVYSFFSDENIWPRGLPLDAIHDVHSLKLDKSRINCPIHQGLADDNPDVDAIFRLVIKNENIKFKNNRVILGKGSWCPFNSQNTKWWPDVYPLLYLPSYCSFRMTDIWRSFVAQRICWENDWSVLFHEPTVYQDRNEHDIVRDFIDEVPGYTMNKDICSKLSELDIKTGKQSMGVNLLVCYKALVEMGVIGEKEIPLLEAWIADLKFLGVLD